MSTLFGGSKVSPGPTPIPIPERTDPAIAAARKKAQLDASRRRGRRATVLTSGQGVTNLANVERPAGKTELLGS